MKERLILLIEQGVEHQKKIVDFLSIISDERKTERLKELKNDYSFNDLSLFSDGYVYKDYQYLRFHTHIYAAIISARAQRLSAKSKSQDYKPLFVIGTERLRNQETSSNMQVDYKQGAFNKELLALALDKDIAYRLDAVLQKNFGGHATAVSFFTSHNRIRCVYIDPSPDPTNMGIIEDIRNLAESQGIKFELIGFQPTNPEQSLQMDEYSCFAFAEAFLHKMHRLSFEDMSNNMQGMESDWAKLPPYFLKYAQRLKILESLGNEHKMGLQQTKTVEDFTKYHTTIVQNVTPKNSPWGTPIEYGLKKQSRALDFYRLKALNYALEMVQGMTEEQVQEMLARRIYGMPNMPDIPLADRVVAVEQPKEQELPKKPEVLPSTPATHPTWTIKNLCFTAIGIVIACVVIKSFIKHIPIDITAPNAPTR